MSEGFENVAVVVRLDQSVAAVCEDSDVANAWIERQNNPWNYYIDVHPVERRRNMRGMTFVGTTSSSDYLKDPDNEKRYWLVEDKEDK